MNFKSIKENHIARVALTVRDLLFDDLGLNKDDPHFRNTPERVAKMFVCEVFKGLYTEPPLLTLFPNKGCDELIMVGPLALRSCCAHHLCPFTGQVWVGYIPKKKLVGLSKFSRLIDWVASRPQTQELLAKQLAEHLSDVLKPAGLGVVVNAHHTCMSWRGVKEHPSASMTTTVMLGAFREDPRARAEFMATLALHR